MRSHLAALTAVFWLLWLVPAAAAGGPTMVLGAADDVVRAPDLAGTKAEMTMLRLAGFRSVRITSIWRPGLSAPTAGELGVLRNVEGAAQLSGVRVFVSVYAAGSGTTPLTPAAQADFAGYAAAIARLALHRRPDRRQRAEPQPLLAPSVRARRRERGCAGVPLSLLALTYDAVKSADPSVRVWGGALARWDRPSEHRTRHALADEVHRRPRCGVSGKQAHEPDHGRARDPPVRRELEHPADLCPPNSRRRSGSRTGKLVGLLGTAFDGTAFRLDAPDPLRGVRGRDHDPDRQGVTLLGRRADDDAAGVDESKQAATARGSAGARVLPAHRRRVLRLPRAGRDCARVLAVRGPPTPTAHRRPATRSSAIPWSEHARGRSRGARV